MMFIDSDGRYTKVSQNSDGTYTVQGGELDDDRNIYIYSQDKEGNYTVRGASIGKTVTETSFYNSDAGKWAIGAVINPHDKLGQEFLDKMESSKITLDNYMANAINGGEYDFKDKGEHYRGMSIKGLKGEGKVFASARDIGNIGAGIIAAKNGLSWKDARTVFDALQSSTNFLRTKKAEWVTEGPSTQNAERYGWEATIRNSSVMKSLGNLYLTQLSITAGIFAPGINLIPR